MRFLISMFFSSKVSSILIILCFSTAFLIMSNMSDTIENIISDYVYLQKINNNKLYSLYPTEVSDKFYNYVVENFDEDEYFYTLQQQQYILIDQEYYEYLVENNIVEPGYNNFGDPKNIEYYFDFKLNYTDSCSTEIFIPVADPIKFLSCNEYTFIVVPRTYFTEYKSEQDYEYFSGSNLIFNIPIDSEKMKDLKEVAYYESESELFDLQQRFKMEFRTKIIYITISILVFILTLYIQSFLVFIKNERDFKVLTLIGKSKFTITIYTTLYTYILNILAVLIATRYVETNLLFVTLYLLLTLIFIHAFSFILVYVFKINDIERIS